MNTKINPVTVKCVKIELILDIMCFVLNDAISYIKVAPRTVTDKLLHTVTVNTGLINYLYDLQTIHLLPKSKAF